MSFDLFAMQQLILDRLAPLAGGVPLVGSFERVDLTDANSDTTAAQVFFLPVTPEGQVGRIPRYFAHWSFDLYIDTERVSNAQREAAMAFFFSAMSSLIGWEYEPGREVQASDGRESGWDERVLRYSFGFKFPAYLAG